ncbi:hypothetical protein L6452_21812 [Arctium lappa]|uniref:Uncharacterized protein n=1 Tax=Arctium lappa TaxID=4217 RepID=A0ACB9AYB6_ARCLA|nr:hypothetical protein L6452_21812 [Arctium lappa]
MGDVTNQLDELKTLLSSCAGINSKSDRSSAYSTLLQLEEHSTTDPSLLKSLADSSNVLLSSMANDISDDDEEIAAQALKCMGFMIYHPSIATGISGDDVDMVLSSLQKVILATRIKSVCNLGVWCVSVQQFSATFLNAHIDSLVRAIVHALDNPSGSLSTTFEAMQAVMKLVTQLPEKMRETSNLWAPPIYRRLISTDKREKDMSERCLLKLKSTICPPPKALSKRLEISESVRVAKFDSGRLSLGLGSCSDAAFTKVGHIGLREHITVFGFINECIISSEQAVILDVKRKLLSALERLLNQGMKIQAMQAWGWFTRLIGPYAMKNRHLINQLLKIPEQTFLDSDPQVKIASQIAWEALVDALIILPSQESMTKAVAQNCSKQEQTYKDNGVFEDNGLTKSIKLIMTPLIGIISSKCDLSVHLSCLNTWNYLLYKLDTSVNHPSVIKTVLEPMLEVVFRVGPNSRNIWSWNFCLDLIDSYALATRIDENRGSDDEPGDQHLAKSPKHYPIKWMPWNLGQFDFFVNVVHIFIGHGEVAYDAALKLFRSSVKGVQSNLSSSSVPFSDVISCINTIIMCLEKISESVISQTFLQFIEIATGELEPSILGSPLYKLTLDTKYTENLNQVNQLKHTKTMAICSEEDGNMVSPVVYLIVLYFHTVVNSTSDAPGDGTVARKLSGYVGLLLMSYDPYDIFHTFTCSLYNYLTTNCLDCWIIIANCLKDYVDGNKDLVSCKSEPDDSWYLLISHFLAYPFVVFSSLSQKKLDVVQIIEPWKSLYVCIHQGYGCLSSQCCKNLFPVFDRFLEDYSEVDPAEKTQSYDFLSLFGDAITCILEHILKSSEPCQRNKDVDDGKRFSRAKTSLQCAARFLSVSYAEAKINQKILDTTSRAFSTLVCFVESFHFDEDIIPFFEIISIPLLQWISDLELQHENTIKLWITILNRSQISRPLINFNSTFLKLQAILLESALDHPNSSISDPTIAFWNSTYGEQMKLDYPQNLLPVLDKLFRNSKIKLCKRSYSRPDAAKITTTLNRCVKRVELVDDHAKGSGSKRKKMELTERQKEVRRAQQGRSKDCEGRGPGVRTYTSVDFSQGNETESQEETYVEKRW